LCRTLSSFGAQGSEPKGSGRKDEILFCVFGHAFTIDSQIPRDRVIDADRRLFVVGELFAPVSQLEERKPRIGLSHLVSSYCTLWFFDHKGLRWLLGRHVTLRLGGVIVEESVEWLVGS
jgi:hypothetical protein